MAPGALTTEVTMQFVEHAVEKSTTEKLEATLNEASDRGREVVTAQFIGGRDWVVISARRLENDASRVASETFKLGGVEHTRVYEPQPPLMGDCEQGGSVGPVHVGFYESTCRTIAPDGVTTPMREAFSGYIENEDRTWILWLDGLGRPYLFYGRRDLDGGVIGGPVDLSGAYGSLAEASAE